MSPAVEAKLAAAGITTAARFAGTDRADTSAQAAEYAVKNLNFTDAHVGVASGYVDGYGADALAGGPLEGKEKSPMLVTKDVNNPGASVLAYLEDHANTLRTVTSTVAPLPSPPRLRPPWRTPPSRLSLRTSLRAGQRARSANATKRPGAELPPVSGIDARRTGPPIRRWLTPSQVTTNSANGVVTFKGTNPGGRWKSATPRLAATPRRSPWSTGRSAARRMLSTPLLTAARLTFSVTTGTGSSRPGCVLARRMATTVLS